MVAPLDVRKLLELVKLAHGIYNLTMKLVLLTLVLSSRISAGGMERNCGIVSLYMYPVWNSIEQVVETAQRNRIEKPINQSKQQI